MDIAPSSTPTSGYYGGYGYGYSAPSSTPTSTPTSDNSDDDSGVAYDAASVDYNGDSLRGLPLSSTVRKFSFCCAPGEYVFHAIDTAGDGWWGDAYYSVIIDGITVVQEEMGSSSSSIQSANFTVALPQSARTVFSMNNASMGGGGAIFWEDTPPENVEIFRSGSSNIALYGDYAATPARTLSATKASYAGVSGNRMSTDPVTVQVMDR